MSPTLLGVLFACLAAIFWGVGNVSARLGMRYMAASTGTFISLAAGFVLTLFVALAVDVNAFLTVSLAAVPAFALVGALQFLAGRFLTFSGIRLAGVTIASAILGAEPLVSAVLAILFLGERLTLWIGVGIPTVVLGVVIVVTAPRSTGIHEEAEMNQPVNEPIVRANSGRSWRNPIILGSLFAALGAVAFAASTTLTRYLVTTMIAPQIITTFALFFGMLYLLGVSARNLSRDLRTPRAGIGWMVAAGVFASLGVLFLFSALANAPVTIVSPIIQVKTLVTVAFTHLFLQRVERVTIRMAFGALLVVMGVVLVILG